LIFKRIISFGKRGGKVRRMPLTGLFINELSATILGQPWIDIGPAGNEGKVNGQE